MDSVQFTYWLRGFIQANINDKGLTDKQLKCIQDTLDTVQPENLFFKNVPNTYSSPGEIIPDPTFPLIVTSRIG